MTKECDFSTRYLIKLIVIELPRRMYLKVISFLVDFIQSSVNNYFVQFLSKKIGITGMARYHFLIEFNVQPKMLLKKLDGYSWIAIVLLLSSCSPTQPSINPNFTTKTIEVSKPTITSNFTQIQPNLTPITTVIPTPISNGYASLPDGEFILYWSQNRLRALSILNKSKVEILQVNGAWLYLSQDMKQIIEVPDNLKNSRIVDLETMEEEKLPFLDGCYDVFILKDGLTFLATCRGPKRNLELFKYTLDGMHRTQLTDCAIEDAGCGRVAISQDGQWMSYLWGSDGSGKSRKTGFYITKSSCIDQEYTCDDLAIGPYSIEFDYVWAPNSKYLASSGINSIHLFEVKDSEIIMVKELQGTPARYSNYFLIWSPDSSQIAYTTGKEIWLVDVPGEDPTLFERFENDVYLIGWVNIKDGKVLP